MAATSCPQQGKWSQQDLVGALVIIMVGGLLAGCHGNTDLGTHRTIEVIWKIGHFCVAPLYDKMTCPTYGIFVQ